MRRIGFNINVRELPWDSFISALRNGNFDMYYGEIKLGADFDLSRLLLPGSLNYGGTASTTYRPFIEDFLAARTQSEMNYAASRLFDEITRNSPFIPILFKRHAIYLQMGATTGVSPSQSNVFRNFTDWTIDLTMLN
jgi:peptide/nickel transport system substrate-binding protein